MSTTKTVNGKPYTPPSRAKRPALKRFEVLEIICIVEAENEQEARKSLPATRGFWLREVTK